MSKGNGSRLTNKQQRFVDEYFLCGMNGSEAARRAQYADPPVAAVRLTKNVNVRAIIEARMSEYAMSANEVLYQLTQIARGDIGDVTDAHGNLDMAKARELGMTGLIAEVTHKTISTEDSDIYEGKVKLYSKMDALKTLAKYHGLLIDRLQVDWRVSLEQAGYDASDIENEFEEMVRDRADVIRLTEGDGSQ